jgi:hypothetical protein
VQHPDDLADTEIPVAELDDGVSLSVSGGFPWGRVFDSIGFLSLERLGKFPGNSMMNMRSHIASITSSKKEKARADDFCPDRWEANRLWNRSGPLTLTCCATTWFERLIDGLFRVAREFHSRAVCGLGSASEQQ